MGNIRIKGIFKILSKITGILFASLGFGQIFYNFIMTALVNPTNLSANIEIWENN